MLIPETAALARAGRRLPTEARALLTLTSSGLVGPERPDRLWSMLRALRRYGPVGAAVTVAAIRHAGRAALIDELGTLTGADLEQRSNAVANALRARGVGPGDGVGVLCRNHRGLIDASFGALKAGARLVLLNTDFAAPQVLTVCDREGVDVLVYDGDTEGAAAAGSLRDSFVAWGAAADGRSGSLEELISSGNPAPPPPPSRPGTVVILTSGTTGTPKGAQRGQPDSLAPLAAILSRIPFRGRQPTFVAPPLHHAWGLGAALLNLALGSPLVIRRHFDPERTLISLAEHRCRSLVVVPVMLDRLLSVDAERLEALDLSHLRIIATSGSQLSGALATRAMEAFGPVLYNLYGSTEVAWATIADPEDLRRAPGCAGRPPLGTTVRVVGPDGCALAAGRTGRIVVGSGMEFTGYTGGGTKAVVGGLMATGDVGHFDPSGRLWVDGREDEMIVSGGENVFPREVEELLCAHEAVADAAAIGVDDAEFGQRLAAFVVRRAGRDIDETGVREHVRANLARYKVPRDVVFVDELPRNPAGKVLKLELARQAAGARRSDDAPR
ncbi:MAG: AMP-binding protein [Acidobacteriota bacterium]|nr:AMP-binding protein [Acidobacteriota bacterium]